MAVPRLLRHQALEFIHPLIHLPVGFSHGLLKGRLRLTSFSARYLHNARIRSTHAIETIQQSRARFIGKKGEVGLHRE